MNCDLCGAEVEEGYLVIIEGSKVIVCEECKEYADKIIEKVKENIHKKRKESQTFIEEELEIREDYGKIIKQKRLEMGLSVKEFSKMLNEKESVVRRIEEEKLIPDEKLAKKIEKLLNISLFRKIEKVNSIVPKKTKLTLGDVAELK